MLPLLIYFYVGITFLSLFPGVDGYLALHVEQISKWSGVAFTVMFIAEEIHVDVLVAGNFYDVFFKVDADGQFLRVKLNVGIGIVTIYLPVEISPYRWQVQCHNRVRIQYLDKSPRYLDIQVSVGIVVYIVKING